MKFYRNVFFKSITNLIYKLLLIKEIQKKLNLLFYQENKSIVKKYSKILLEKYYKIFDN